MMSWVHGKTTVVIAFGLLLMLMESQKHRGKVKPHVAGDDSVPYKVCKRYYINKASPDFRRMIVFLEGTCMCMSVS